MKFGSNDITDVKLGTTQIVEVRKGTTLVWSKGGSELAYSINILSPSEGEEVLTGFTMTATDNQNTINIILTEGQEVETDFTVTFE